MNQTTPMNRTARSQWMIATLGAAVLALTACTAPESRSDVREARSGMGSDAVKRADCSALVQLKLADASVVSATAAYGLGMPYICRVVGVARPTSDSNINFEIWLPAASAWNGKFYSAAGAGSIGALMYEPMVSSVRRGYASMTQDRGHASRPDTSAGLFGDGEWAFKRPEKIVDWSHRSQHVATVASKAIISAFYGSEAKHSYFESCSAGGHLALMEATRYPQDYDGIIAGAPGDQWTHTLAGRLWAALPARKGKEYIIPTEKLALLNRTAVQACDALDGVADGLIEDPRACKFDPSVLQCKPGSTSDCLTEAQIQTAKAIYGGLVRPGSNERIAHGFMPGSEFDWEIIANTYKLPGSAPDFLRFWAYEDPAYDSRNFDFDKGWDAINNKKVGGQTMAELTNVKPDLSKFRQRGGRLIRWHGWADTSVAPQSSIDFYEQIVKQETKAGADEVMRLFMAPGVAHCRGGPGPNSFDMLGALEGWVEKSTPPERVVANSFASGGTLTRSRPLCAYPKVARYSGVGNHDRVESFSCVDAPSKRAL
ncbi:feruloyl esterase [Variovorax boronicumulans]|uniref:Feruloyl esterase n=1 Tax=Variovorax boronicumulans TaxID=436515 RepID=A0AAW8DTQ8_9BURK|nr:tannase/feruloyl esterase family alpha/beta hydrolase [Variovorax boronicumulans]MDP9877663.1 feruloyl esterase [Variovorax boronicumulans]MDP9922948.1 feruloyl esterase [Variovorax boronicumulans]